MLKFAPNIYVMQYLTNTEQLQPEISSMALKYLHTGERKGDRGQGGDHLGSAGLTSQMECDKIWKIDH